MMVQRASMENPIDHAAFGCVNARGVDTPNESLQCSLGHAQLSRISKQYSMSTLSVVAGSWYEAVALNIYRNLGKPARQKYNAANR
jgi:hypothetical protein